MGLSAEVLRALELHEARAHGHGDRVVRDLGDAILLTDPTESDPFLNRATGLRLADDADGLERRLAELYALFATLARRPHLWFWEGVDSPPGLVGRIVADGFLDLGGTWAMVLYGSPARVPTPRGVRIEWLSAAGERATALVQGAALVMVEAFGTTAGDVDTVAADLGRAPSPAWDVCLLSVGGEPVAAGRRYTANGMTHLSSIATRPSRWGRGYGAAVTAALANDGRRLGGRLAHLGVEAQNVRARRLYARVGFAVAGGPIADLLLG
jgi:ribosomal protein S18 acetylase RimI-like enzyme